MPRRTWTSCWRSASAPRPRPSGEATAVIAAAGSGERLGAGGPKAFVELAGRPLLDFSLDAFARAASVGAIVVAVPPGAESRVGERAAAVAGGATRAASVAAALARVETDLVAVHDAARPLVTPELIDALVEALASRPNAAGVIAAAPIGDTVKLGGRPGAAVHGPPLVPVERTLDRDRLWSVQTPQVFRAAALREAHAAGPAALRTATDDAMLVEAAGGEVLIVPGPPENIKVTTPRDLRLAELLLDERRR